MLNRLQDLKKLHHRLDKIIYFTAILAKELEVYGVKPVLVGGGALEFYTQGSYTTVDVDLVVQGRDSAKKILSKMGFRRGLGQKSWYSESLELSVEIPDDTLAGSMDRITVVELEDDLTAYVIGVEDLIVDRLNAYKHWKSLNDGQWAMATMLIHMDDIDFAYLKARAREEDTLDVLAEIVKKAKKIKKKINKNKPKEASGQTE